MSDCPPGQAFQGIFGGPLDPDELLGELELGRELLEGRVEEAEGCVEELGFGEDGGVDDPEGCVELSELRESDERLDDLPLGDEDPELSAMPVSFILKSYQAEFRL